MQDVDSGDIPGYGRMRRRRIIVIAVVLLAVIAAGGGLLLSTSIKSPQQVRAGTAAPGATRLTVPVQRQVISNSVIAQGVVSQPPQISQVANSDGVPAGSNPAGSDAQPIVTGIFRHPGRTVEPGTVILNVAQQPLFVLQGSVPAYRNLIPGETGIDVAQLQQGLGLLGYPVGYDTSGDYGPGTAAAVAAFYQAIGYTAPKISTGPKARRGAWVPLSEIMFVPRLPARVVSIGAKIGAAPRGSLVTLSIGHPAIKGQLNPADRPLVRRGMTVRITDPVNGKSMSGTVTSVGSHIESKKSLSGGVYLRLGVRASRSLALSLAGQDVTLTVTGARSSGPVLAVPEAAVFAAANGQTYVSKVTGPAAQVRVAVRAGMTGDGLVQVTPLRAGSLRAGNQVVTGQDFARQGGSG